MSVSPSSSLLLEDNHGKGQDIVVIHLASLHQAILPARVSSGVSLQKRRPKSTGRSQQHFVRLFFTKLLQKLLAVLGSIEVPLVLGAKVETKLLGLSPACPRAPKHLTTTASSRDYSTEVGASENETQCDASAAPSFPPRDLQHPGGEPQ